MHTDEHRLKADKEKGDEVGRVVPIAARAESRGHPDRAFRDATRVPPGSLSAAPKAAFGGPMREWGGGPLPSKPTAKEGIGRRGHKEHKESLGLAVDGPSPFVPFVPFVAIFQSMFVPGLPYLYHPPWLGPRVGDGGMERK